MNILYLSELCGIIYRNTGSDGPYLQSYPLKSLNIENKFLKNYLAVKLDLNRY